MEARIIKGVTAWIKENSNLCPVSTRVFEKETFSDKQSTDPRPTVTANNYGEAPPPLVADHIPLETANVEHTIEEILSSYNNQQTEVSNFPS